MTGFLQFVLHSHLPFVLSHGRWPHGADWIFEASAETYIPLLQNLHKSKQLGTPLKFTIGISPVLLEQLSHPSFSEQFSEYLKMKISSAENDKKYFNEISDIQRLNLANMWEKFYTDVLRFFESIQGDIVSEFRRWQDSEFIEIITCAATHGYLPLLGTDNSIYAQIAVAKKVHKRHFGVDPKGIWLPEAAYRPGYEWIPPVGNDKTPRLRKGIEQFLYNLDIRFFVVDSHLLKGGKATGVYIDRFEALKKLWSQFESQYVPREEVPRSPYKPYLCSSTNGKYATPFFVRDPKSGLQVWSGEWGYPGNPAYLDFHKKHFPGGHRYWRVTDANADLADKNIYRPEWIPNVIAEQGYHFVQLCSEIIRENAANLNQPPIITAPFDTELFGHWWFEGPRWLLEVAQNIAKNETLEMSCGWEFLEKFPPGEVVELPEGSWGQGGFHYIWLNSWTEWTWEKIYEAEKIMVEFANKFEDRRNDDGLHRVLSQLGRELLLLESSDWQFLISTWSARDYAENRVSFHWEKFNEIKKIADILMSGGQPSSGMWREFELIELQDDIFPELDPTLWADSNLNFEEKE